MKQFSILAASLGVLSYEWSLSKAIEEKRLHVNETTTTEDTVYYESKPSLSFCLLLFLLHTCLYMHTHTFNTGPHTRVYESILTYAHIHIVVCMCVHTHVHTNTHIHASVFPTEMHSNRVLNS